MKKITLALAFAAALTSSVFAQGIGDLPSGNVWGNPTASPGLAQPSTPDAILDRYYTGVVGCLLNRGVSVWTCTRTPQLGASGTLGSMIFGNATSGTVTIQPVTGALGSAVMSIPAATDTLVGKATTDILTNKTYDTASAGNSLLINGVAATANTGTGAVVRAVAPVFTGGTSTTGGVSSDYFVGRGPTSFSSTSGSMSSNDNFIIIAASGTFTLTLLPASSWIGRTLYLKNTTAQIVNSASSNVVPLASASGNGTAIFPATANKWAILISDGNFWQIAAGN